MADREWGVCANVAGADKVLRNGARADVLLLNPGWGSERVFVSCLSRGGRRVEKWIPSKALTNARARWIHETQRARFGMFATKEDAERAAQAVAQWAAEVTDID